MSGVGDYTIEPMAEQDYAQVAALWRTTGGLGEVESEAEFSVFLRRNLGFSPIAKREDEIIGAMFSGHDGRRGYLSHLAVAPEFRRSGVASALVEWALQRLREVPVRRVSVHVYHDNDSAIAFWRGVRWRDRDDLRVLAIDLMP